MQRERKVPQNSVVVIVWTKTKTNMESCILLNNDVMGVLKIIWQGERIKSDGIGTETNSWGCYLEFLNSMLQYDNSKGNIHVTLVFHRKPIFRMQC